MTSVVRVLLSRDGTWRADIFQRHDGTFGFRARRRDARASAWLDAGRFSESITESADAAEREARARIPHLERARVGEA